MTARCAPTETSHSYHVVMIDHGKRGLEAIVHPERTRRDIIDMVRHGEFKEIAFIHYVKVKVPLDGLSYSSVEDVTQEIMDAAELQAMEEDRICAAEARADARRDAMMLGDV